MRLLDQAQIVSGFVPVDTQTAANTGDVVSLKNYNHLTVLFFKAAGVAGDDPDLTIEQGTDVAFGTAKALTVTEYHVKKGAALTAIGQFTAVTQAASGTVSLDATSAEEQAIVVVEIDASSLDVVNGYDCVRVSVPDTGNAGAQLGCMLYILTEPRYAGAAMPSATVD